MDIDLLASITLTFLVSTLRTRQHLCCPRHAALQILAIPPGIAAVCALPGTPITALASASNYRS